MQYIYKSRLNALVTNTATFSDGAVRFGWKPPSFFNVIFLLTLKGNS